jgi:arylsulfatase A-like enzyme
MDRPSAVCLLVDGLQAGFLGCYGNTWAPTPVIDRLASRALVCDQAFAAGPNLEQAYAALWRGARLPAAGCDAVAPGSGLPEVAQAAGFHTRLVTDDGRVAAWGERAGFGAVTFVKPPDVPAAAATADETQFARLLAVAADEWLAAPRPCFLWVHSQGLSGAWDAPHPFRQQLQDEEDPEPPRWIVPPCETLAPDADPDYLLGITQAYAGQVAALDACLEGFVEIVAAEPGAGALLALLAPRGFPLGEHGRIGLDSAPPLHGELLHVPWILSSAGLARGPARSGALVHLSDLPAAIAAWLGALWERSEAWEPALRPEDASQPEGAGRGPAAHEFLGFRGESDCALRTPAWFYRWSRHKNDQTVALFAKPDDRWEVNDVHDRCPEVLEELSRLAKVLTGHDPPAALPPLSPLAREGLR